MADNDKEGKKAGSGSFIFVGCLIIGLGVGIGFGVPPFLVPPTMRDFLLSPMVV